MSNVRIVRKSITHFAPLLSSSSSAPTLCGNEDRHDSICNSLSAVTCEDCKNEYETLKQATERKREAILLNLPALTDSLKCGFIHPDEFLSILAEKALIAEAGI